MTDHGHFHWNELMTRDVEGAKAFYADTLGWEYISVDMGPDGTYWVVQDGETPIGGIYQMSGESFEGVPDQWTPYIAVDDIDARIEKARQAGATIVQEPFDVAGVGRIAMLKEPGGAMLGWMTPE